MGNVAPSSHSIWKFFDEVKQIPRPSKHEELIIKHLEQFAKDRNLNYKIDRVGNIVISKPATKGNENKKTVVLQSHVDMVCEKDPNIDFDFTTDPIQSYIDGEWMKAKGTTLGADNGIGVAAQLTLLDSTEIPHGPIECLFTIDEETGLTGAFELDDNLITGNTLLNLDSEDIGDIYIGCAGGIDTVATIDYTMESSPNHYFYFSVEVTGLVGGHSGDDINKGRANANKLLVDFLNRLKEETDLVLCEIDGGNLRNAIARTARAVAGVPYSMKEQVRITLNHYLTEIEEQYGETDPKINIILSSEASQPLMFPEWFTEQLLEVVTRCPHGVVSMSQKIEGLVETSTNLASIKMKSDNTIVIATLQRSSNDEALSKIAEEVAEALTMESAKVVHSNGYPGWNPNTNSPILRIAIETHNRLFGVDPNVKAIHAGLECGLFLQKYPNLDMISFGPTIKDPHSPGERLHIPSVEQWWKHLVAILQAVK
ncbi:aminoacyl-histidine dipeptidase [Porphyromonadaceae bacterium]